MRHIKRFNEQVQEEVQAQGESQGKDFDACIEAAKECIKKCEECKAKCEEDGHEECAKSCEECIKACELYIYSCENKSPNFEKIGRLAFDVATDCATTCSDGGHGICVEACLDFSEEVEKCLE